MLNGRLYRAAFLPLLPVLVVVAFSLSDAPAPLTTTLPSNLFLGQQAIGLLHQMAKLAPDRRPGSPGDQRLAAYVAQQLRSPEDQPAQEAPGPCGTSSTFCVRIDRYRAQTIDGERDLENVIATRPGAPGPQLVVVAHRDAAGLGSQAELSGTAALLELGNVLSGLVTHRTITLISTDGGSGGAAGAARVASEVQGPVDGVIALGDLDGLHARTPLLIGWSDGLGGAPPLLVQTIKAAITNQVGIPAGTPSFATQFAHLAMPFAVGEEGMLNAHGLPAALIQVTGEQGPAPDDQVDVNPNGRLQNFGRAALTALDALDAGPDIPAAQQDMLQLHGKLIPSWAVRLLVAALLLPVLVVTFDALARVRRRREPVLRWLRWVVSCALPFFVCALTVVVLATSGELTAAPPAPVLPRALPVSSVARAPLIAALLVLVLAWMAWTWATVTLGQGRPRAGSAGVALLLVLSGVCLAIWLVNPFAALLLVPAAHFALVLASPQLRPRVPFGIALVVLSLLPAAAVVALYARQFGMGPLEVAWTALLLVAGGHISLLAAAVWSLALGCAVAGLLLALCGRTPSPEQVPAKPRGTVSYTGPAPGSLGESALRR